MRKDVKDLADAMERGWNKVPHMNRRLYYKEYDGRIVAACAMGHAALGNQSHKTKNVDTNNQLAIFRILDEQMVSYEGTEINLWNAIANLNDDYGWTTPQIVAWLRSHLND